MKPIFIFLFICLFVFTKSNFSNSSINKTDLMILNSQSIITQDCENDPYEPNDNPASAYHINFGDTVSGAFICPIEDYDYFTFNATEGNFIRIFEINPNLLRPTIYILNSNLTPIYNNLYTTDMKFFINSTEQYYIVVTRRYNTNDPFPYSFGLEKLNVNPDIISVTDVPNDQGLQVQIVWKPSYFNPQQGINQTDFYALWRKVNDSLNNKELSISGIYESFNQINYSEINLDINNIYSIEGSEWNFIAQIPAVANRPFNNYSFIASTLYDNFPTTFVVSAVPKYGFNLPVLWGLTETGISIDNINPEFNNYNIESNANGILLKWEIDRLIHYDIEGYKIYRQTNQNINLIDENIIAELDDAALEYLDSDVIEGNEYFYIIEIFDNSGNSTFSSEMSLTISSIEENNFSIRNFNLIQNYPNPFNPSTTIVFTLPVDAIVSLKIFDILGQEVVSLINKELAAGSHESVFDATKYKSGVYFYRMEAKGKDGRDFNSIKKMLLLK